MAVKVDLVRFAKRSGVGTQVVSHNLGEVPKAYLFWGGFLAADGFQAHIREWWGFSVGTVAAENRASYVHTTDAVATQDNRGGASALSCIKIISSVTPTIEGAAQISAESTTDFTLNWTTSTTNLPICFCLVIGGDEVTNASTVEKTWAIAAGNQSFTGVGFRPDLVIYLDGQDRTTSGDGTDYLTGIGVATDVGGAKQWLIVNSQDDGAGGSSGRHQRTDSMAGGMNVGGSAFLKRATFVSMDTDGWTWNVATAPATAYIFWALCLKFQNPSTNVNVGMVARATSGGGTNDVTTGFDTKGLWLHSVKSPTLDTFLTGMNIGRGGTDFTDEECYAFDSPEAATTDDNESIVTGKAIREMTSPSTTAAEADASVITNGFRLTWSTADANANRIHWIAFGQAAAAAAFPPRPVIINQAMHRAASW